MLVTKSVDSNAAIARAMYGEDNIRIAPFAGNLIVYRWAERKGERVLVEFTPTDYINDARIMLESCPCVVIDWLVSLRMWSVSIYGYNEAYGHSQARDFCMAACEAFLLSKRKDGANDRQ